MAGERFGPYELRSLLGRGGMGEVYRAVDTRKSRGVVALKRLPAGLAADADFQRRFLREAELAARLRDPHVIPIHDYGEIDGQPYLDMRLVDGVDLATHLERHGPLPPARTVSIITQVADALDAAHRDGLVHRDVKPQNILLNRPHGADDADQDDRDFVYLIDFGIAANLLSSRRSSSVVSGTAAYMAPERFTAGGDHRVDVYALGCVLHELLTGRTPFTGDVMQLMHAHATTAPPAPSALDPSLPPALDAVVATAMAKDPARRQPDAGSLATAARRALAATPPTPAPPPAVGRPPSAEPPRASRPAEVARARPGAGPPRRPDPPGAPGARPGDRRRQRAAFAVAGVVAVLAAVLVTTTLLDAGPPGPPVLGTVAVGGGPRGIALAPDGRRAYVANQAPSSVSVIDTSTDTVTASIPVQGGPAASLAVAPDGRRVYVAARFGATVSVIDTASNAVTATIPADAPSSVAVTPDGRRAYISTVGRVLVVDTGRNTVTATIPVANTGGGLAITPDGRRVYLTSMFGDTPMSVIDTSGNTVATTPVRVGGDVAIAPDGRHAYISNNSANAVSVVDTASNTVTATVGVGSRPVGVAITADGRRAYTADLKGDSVTEIDTSRNTDTATIDVGDGPVGVAITPDGRRAYTTNTNDNSVSVVRVG